MEDEREARFRRSILPALYGLAAANFITLIQFASTAQIQRGMSLAGMILMGISVPALVGCAVYADTIVHGKPIAKTLSPVFFGAVTAIGVIGISLTLTAFQWWVGSAFGWTGLIAIVWITIAARRAARVER